MIRGLSRDGLWRVGLWARPVALRVWLFAGFNLKEEEDTTIPHTRQNT